MASSKGRGAAQPEGMIRRSQLVTTYGPGAMVDLVNTAVLVGGLDFWNYDRKKTDPTISAHFADGDRADQAS